MLTILLSMLLNVAFYSESILFHKASISESLNNLVLEAKFLFPKDLEVRFDNNELTINQPSPYLIKPSWLEEQDGLKYLIVYDEFGKFEDFTNYQTIVLLTRNFIAGKKESGEISMMKLSELNLADNMYFNHTMYSDLVDKIIKEIISNKFVIILAGMIIVLFMSGVVLVGIVMYQLLALLFYALIGLIIAKISNRDFNYSECYLNAMYIFVPMTLLSWFMPNIFIFLLRVLVFGVLFYLFVQKDKARQALSLGN
jgi:hypothetical protein